MKFNILSFFKNKPKIKGIISQYHLEDWWYNNFNDNDREEIIIALNKVVTFGVSLSGNESGKNSFTNSDFYSTAITPFFYLLKPLNEIKPNSELGLKYIKALEDLMPRYLDSNFNIIDEIKSLNLKESEDIIINDYIIGTRCLYTDIEYFFGAMIFMYNNFKKDEFCFTRYKHYCKKYFELSDRFFNSRKKVRLALIKDLNIKQSDIYEWRENERLSSSKLEKYIMILQNSGKYYEALEAINHIQKIGWKNDWTKRIEILNKKIEKANCQKN